MLSFCSIASGFNIENTDPEYMEEIRQFTSYANSKNIEVGGYDLIALSRKNNNSDYAALSSEMHSIGSSCMASAW